MMSYVVDVVRRIVDGVLFADGQLQLQVTATVLAPVGQERRAKKDTKTRTNYICGVGRS